MKHTDENIRFIEQQKKTLDAYKDMIARAKEILNKEKEELSVRGLHTNPIFISAY